MMSIARQKLRSPYWLALAAALLALAVVPRFMNLGLRPLMHDESMFAFYSYDSWVRMKKEPLIGPDGQPGPSQPMYTHMPIMHGPTLMLVTAVAFDIFGDTIAVARGFIALASLAGLAAALALWPRRLRWWLAPLLLTSPILLFWSRFFRDDMLFTSILLLGVLGVSRGMMRGIRWRAAWAVFGVTMLFALLTIMENALFVYAAAATFGVVCLACRVIRRTKPRWWRMLRNFRPAPRIHPDAKFSVRPTPSKKKKKESYLKPSYATVVGEETAGAAENRETLDATPPEHANKKSDRLARTLSWTAGAFVGFFVIALVYGILSGQAAVDLDPEPEAAGLTVFLADTLKQKSWLFNSLQNLGWTNLLASWQYWSDQHAQHRISGPLHYHLPIIATYEMPMVLLLYAGLLWDALLKRRRAFFYAGFCLLAIALWVVFRIAGPPDIGEDAGIVDKILKFLHLEPSMSLLVLSLLIAPLLAWSVLQLFERRALAGWLGWWAACSLFQYSVAGEKVPWLALHIAAPMYVMLGWLWAPLLRNRRPRAKIIFVSLALAAALIGFRTDWRFMKTGGGDPGERSVFNHTTYKVDEAINSRLALWRAQADEKPLKERRVLLVDHPTLGGPSWPGLWYFRHTTYHMTTNPGPMMNQPWDFVIGQKDVMQPLLATLDREDWNEREMSLRDHWWAPWPEEVQWQAWARGQTDALGQRHNLMSLLGKSIKQWWRYFWLRETWTLPGGYPIIILEPTKPD